LRDRAEERGLRPWFGLEMVPHAGCEQRGAAERLGGLERRIPPERTLDRGECR
jgi:hypothetical protein